MKKATCTCLLAISFLFFVKEGFCQKAAEENFLGFAKSYLEYSVKYHNLNDNTVFIATAGNNKQSTFFYKKGSPFFRITFKYDYEMLNYRYDMVYKLVDYKLIVNEGFNLDTTILNKIFEPRPCENLNK